MPNQYLFGLSDLNKELEEEFEPGEELEEEDFEEIKTGTLKQSSFPIITLIFAILKDFIDLVTLGILGLITNIIAWIVISFYLSGKVGFIKRWLYRRYIFALILELIPFINMIPQWTIFVLRAHATEHKKIDQILTAIEKLIIRHSKE